MASQNAQRGETIVNEEFYADSVEAEEYEDDDDQESDDSLVTEANVDGLYPRSVQSEVTSPRSRSNFLEQRLYDMLKPPRSFKPSRLDTPIGMVDYEPQSFVTASNQVPPSFEQDQGLTIIPGSSAHTHMLHELSHNLLQTSFYMPGRNVLSPSFVRLHPPFSYAAVGNQCDQHATFSESRNIDPSAADLRGVSSFSPFPMPLVQPPTATVQCTSVPNGNTEWVGVSGDPNRSFVDPMSIQNSIPNLIAFGQSVPSCPYHLMTTTAITESSNQPQAISAATHNLNVMSTNTDPLTVGTISMPPLSIPPLQPASRFRKARIHDTIELWSNGRVAVHDCHLKAIPDWVCVLQKNTTQLDEDIALGMNQNFNCFSCLDSDTTAILPNSADRSTQKPPWSSCADASLAQALACSRGFEVTQLFSFWNDGCRINCQLQPNRDRSSTNTSGIMHSVRSGNDEGNITYVPTTDHSVSAVAAKDKVSQTDATAESKLEVSDIAHPSTSRQLVTDPATAYLRRVHTNEQNVQPLSPNAIISFNEVCPSLTPELPPMPVNDISMPEFALDSSLSNIEPPRIHVQNLQTNKDLNHSLTTLTGFVPPTSPTGLPESDSRRFSSSALLLKPNLTDVANGLYESLEQTLFGKHSKLYTNERTRTSSGRYVNVYSDSNKVGETDPSLCNHLCPMYNRADLPTDTQDDAVHVEGSSQPVNGRLSPDVSQSHDRPKSLSSSSCPVSNDLLPLDQELCPHHGSSVSWDVSTRLEARIHETMDSIRSTVVNSFRDQLAAVHSENMGLAAQVERLTAEVSVLRQYQAAFYALRPYVAPEIWDQLTSQPVPHIQSHSAVEPSISIDPKTGLTSHAPKEQSNI